MHEKQARQLQILMRRRQIKRRPIRFSLSTLLLLFTLLGLAIAGFNHFVGSHIREYRREQQTLAELRGQAAVDAVIRQVEAAAKKLAETRRK